MNDEIGNIVRSTANRLSKKWKQDRDDISQELFLWIFQKLDYTFFDEYLNADDYDGVVEYAEKLKRFRSSINWAGERYCRQEKADKEGYSVRDEYFYSIPQLQVLLPIYLTAGVEANPPKSFGESVRRSVDASEGGGHLASMLDIDTAFQKLTSTYKDRLWVRFGPLEDLSDETIAGLSQSEIVDLTRWHPDKLRSVLGMTKDQVRHRTSTALQRLQRELGGSSPWRSQGYADAA